jgi:hypothetical protein
MVDAPLVEHKLKQYLETTKLTFFMMNCVMNKLMKGHVCLQDDPTIFMHVCYYYRRLEAHFIKTFSLMLKLLISGQHVYLMKFQACLPCCVPFYEVNCLNQCWVILIILGYPLVPILTTDFKNH